jgi:2-iminobutanoate/2-iminopropanoate deaminase
MGFENVVRCGIFLADMGDFAVVNGIYATRFASDPPARATVQVAVLPKNVRIEIDAIAVAP